MANLRPTLTDLSAGELSPSLAGRVDAAIYYRGCQTMTNWIPRRTGGAGKRGGFEYVGEVYNSSRGRLIPFVVSADIVMFLEFTNLYLRIWANDHLVLSGGNPLTIVSPYSSTDIPYLKYCQINKTLVITRRGKAPWTLRYVSGTFAGGVLDATLQYGTPSFIGNWLSWTAPTETPWYTSDLWEKSAQWMTENKVYPGGGTFNGKTILNAVRTSNVLTLTFTDLTTLALTESATYSYQGTIEIDFRCFGAAGDYPGACSVKNGRLHMAGTDNEPNADFASKPLDYFNFTFFEDVEYEETNPIDYVSPFTIAGTVVAGSKTMSMSAGDIAQMKRGYHLIGTGLPDNTKVKSIDTTACTLEMTLAATESGSPSVSVNAWLDAEIPEYTYDTVVKQQIGPGSAMKLLLDTEEAEFIQWICAGQDIILGTGSSEFAMPGNATATDASVALTGRHGSADMQARNVGGTPLFVQQSGKRMRAWTPDGKSPAINDFADHILESGVVEWDFQSDPDGAVWAVGGDGNIFRGDIESAPVSWTRIHTRDGDVFESGAVAATPAGDILYAIVNRVIGGVHKRYVEKYTINKDASFLDINYLDCSTKKTSLAPFTTVLGLERFEGQNVIYYAGSSDSSMVQGSAIVAAGSITIPSSLCAYVGLLYKATLKTYRLETAETEGIRKFVPSIFFRLFRCGPFTIRYTEDPEEDFDTLTPPSAFYTGPISQDRSSGTSTDQAIIIESESPWPVGILGIVPEIELGQTPTGVQ